ncbi:hypothetical protein ACFQX6_65740 [Streptosporangium lutulentum]
MQTDDGRQLDGSIQESAETVHALAAEVRTHLDSYDADTRQLLGALADEVDTVAAELLEMRSRIPQMEAESLFLREARAQAEARGEQVLAEGAIGYEEWEAVQLKEMPSPGGQAPGWGTIL